MAGPFSERLWLHAPAGLTDLSGNGNDGAFVNGASISGGNYVLTTTGDGIVIADNATLDITGAMTISWWMQCDATASKTFFHKWIGGASWKVQTQAGSLVQFQYTSDGTGGTFGQWTSSTAPSLTGSLRHFMIASDTGVSLFYINGVSVARSSPTVRTTFFSGDAPVYVGGPAVGTQSGFTGLAADIRIIPSLLSAGDAVTLYNGGVPGYGYSPATGTLRRQSAQTIIRGAF
jgi:hypothetical protein